MRQYGYFDFFDSSIFDLEAMIEEKVTGVSDEMVISILNEKFADFAIYPHRYNERFHIFWRLLRPHKHICYYDSVESVRQRRALEAKNFRGFLRE